MIMSLQQLSHATTTVNVLGNCAKKWALSGYEPFLFLLLLLDTYLDPLNYYFVLIPANKKCTAIYMYWYLPCLPAKNAPLSPPPHF